MKKLLFSFLVGMVWPLLAAQSASAATFNIANGDVAGLKNAITTSNTNSQDDTINLAAGGLYTLTAIDNTGTNFGNNGLPVIVSETGKSGTGCHPAQSVRAARPYL
jgi:hypothetical protein